MAETQHGAMIWFELYATDLERAKAFYEAVFGWRTRPFSGYDEDNYLLVSTPWSARSIGAIVRRGSGPTSDERLGTSEPRFEPWTTVPYLEVTELSAAIEQSRQHGAEVLAEPRRIGPADGYFAVIRDPEGNQLGVWSATEPRQDRPQE